MFIYNTQGCIQIFFFWDGKTYSVLLLLSDLERSSLPGSLDLHV